MKTNQQIKSRERAFIANPFRRSLAFLKNPFSPLAFLDLALIVVLFFITLHYSQLVRRPGIKLDLPQSEFRSGTHYNKFDTVLITLSREGMVFFNDELTNLDGLGALIAQAAYKNPEVSILIQADGNIDYGNLVRIYNMASEAGIESITMATSITPQTNQET